MLDTLPGPLPILGMATVVFGLLGLCATALPFLLLAAYFWRKADQGTANAVTAATWPSVLGKVVSSSVELRTSTDSEGDVTNSYYPNVVYTYDVGGQSFQGSAIAFGDAVGSAFKSQIQSVADRYVPGNQVRVYYDPGEPSRAVLERQAPASKFLRGFAILIVTVVVCGACSTGAGLVLQFLLNSGSLAPAAR